MAVKDTLTEMVREDNPDVEEYAWEEAPVIGEVICSSSEAVAETIGLTPVTRADVALVSTEVNEFTPEEESEKAEEFVRHVDVLGVFKPSNALAEDAEGTDADSVADAALVDTPLVREPDKLPMLEDIEPVRLPRVLAKLLSAPRDRAVGEVTVADEPTLIPVLDTADVVVVEVIGGL